MKVAVAFDHRGVRLREAVLVGAFLGAVFVAEGRYLARLEKVEELERLVEG